MKKVLICFMCIFMLGTIQMNAQEIQYDQQETLYDEIEQYQQQKTNTEITREEVLLRIKQKIRPSIVYGIMNINKGAIKKGERVQILEDRGNGERYHIKKDKIDSWVQASEVQVLKETKSSAPEQLSKEELELYMNESENKSDTPYFIWVDIDRQLTYVFKGKKKNWKLHKILESATGIDKTPTKRGLYKIQERGYEFGTNVRARYWVRYDGSYLFHSVPYDKNGKILDATLGAKASNGCVRLSMENAYWFYSNIPRNTAVWVY